MQILFWQYFPYFLFIFYSYELPDGDERDSGIAGWENMGMGFKFQMGMGMVIEMGRNWYE